MSTGKKPSGFKITSVTSDYGQAGSEGRKESFSSDSGSTKLTPLANGGHSLPSRSPWTSPHSSPPTSASTHALEGADVLPLHMAPKPKEGEAGTTDEVRTALPSDHDVGAALPVRGKDSSGPLCSTSTLVGLPANAGETLSSQQMSSSFATLGKGQASNVSQTSSGSPQLQVNTSNGHASLVNGTDLSHESKAGSSNGAISKNGPLPSVVNGSVGSPVSSAGPVAASSSRFRVVKLDQGLGEPYKRGRWTCVDFHDKDMDNHSISKILDNMRHRRSLDSHLEVAGLAFKPVTQFYPQSPGKAIGTPFVHSQGTAHMVLHNANLKVTSPHQVRSLSGLPQLNLERSQDTGLKSPLSMRNSPTSEFHSLLPISRTNNATQWGNMPTIPSDAYPASSGQETSRFSSSEDGSLANHTSAILSEPTNQGPQGFHAVPVVVVDGPGTSHPMPKSVLQLIKAEDTRKISVQDSRSRSPSPGRHSLPESSPNRTLSDSFSVHSARLSLARSMFSMGGPSDSDDESGSGSSMVAIDNKIEQAMDLVKAHLMFAVREEVEVLREQIKELMERNTLLEQENSVLKSLASPEQLSQMQAKMHSIRLGLAPPTTSSTTNA